MKQENTVLCEGVENFEENQHGIHLHSLGVRLTTGELLERELYHPKYHGEKRPGCILVKKRLEKTYQDHYLTIFTCLTCGEHIECLRGGWEIGWAGGTNSREL